jgi:hypothetical protein
LWQVPPAFNGKFQVKVAIAGPFAQNPVETVWNTLD